MIKKPFQVIKRLTKSCQTTKTPNESKTAPPSAPGNETELVRPGYLPEINPGAKGFISAVHPYGSPEARYHAQIGRDPRIVPYTYGEQHVNAPSYLPHPEERIENYYACPSCGYKMSFPQELLDEVCNQVYSSQVYSSQPNKPFSQDRRTESSKIPLSDSSQFYASW